MEHSRTYRSKHGQEILAFLAAQGGRAVRVAEVYDHFRELGAPMGLATIYRHLDRLVSQGRVKRIATGDASGVCYQFAGDGCERCVYLKCESCGSLTPLRCGAFDEVQRHIRREHGFLCEPGKSVLYGTCAGCAGAGTG